MTMQRENLGPFDRVWEDAPPLTKPSAVLEKARKAYEDRVANNLNDPDEPTVLGCLGLPSKTVRVSPIASLPELGTEYCGIPGTAGIACDVLLGREFPSQDPIPSPQEKRVDPMWDRYFELAFQQACYMVFHKGEVVFANDEGKRIDIHEWAGGMADRMLAERNKRLG